MISAYMPSNLHILLIDFILFLQSLQNFIFMVICFHIEPLFFYKINYHYGFRFVQNTHLPLNCNEDKDKILTLCVRICFGNVCECM